MGGYTPRGRGRTHGSGYDEVQGQGRLFGPRTSAWSVINWAYDMRPWEDEEEAADGRELGGGGGHAAPNLPRGTGRTAVVYGTGLRIGNGGQRVHEWKIRASVVALSLL